MILYLVNFIHSFISVPLIAGMLIALWKPLQGQKAALYIGIGIAAGLAGGALIYSVSASKETVTAARTALYAACLSAAVLHTGILVLSKKHMPAPFVGGGTAAVLSTALAANAIFSFIALSAENALSSIGILNTELIRSIGGILVGVCIIAFIAPLTVRLCAGSSRSAAFGFLTAGIAFLLIKWIAEVMLGLMRLETIELTSTRLSFVAKVTHYSFILAYIQILIITAMSLVFFFRRTAITPYELSAMQNAERRKARSKGLYEARWFKSALTIVMIALSALLYHDLYASRPPRISTPVNLKPDANGLIKVNIGEAGDGKLHRYSYVTDDGHVVRFFMINRMSGSRGGQARIGVVYDACMLCGDMGYIQSKSEIICIACNVRIFVPSIGKAGGCNPIPLAHTVENGQIVINAEELDKGAKYFSRVISVKVKDPVTGKTMNSLKSPHRFEYKGRTYFFESEESAEKFRASPETYIGDRQSRYFPVQGCQRT